MQRGIERRKIFRDNSDREEFLRRLAEGLKETGHKCYGWALMPNHFHLLVRTGLKPLSALMRTLLTGYAVYFNRKHHRSGHVYQNRFKSILCQEENYLLELVRYIHLNPLRARLVKDMDELANYKWSGHSVLSGKKSAEWQSTDEILERFASKRSDAISGYIKFVNEAKDMGHREEFSGGGLVRSVGGWKELISMSRSGQRQMGDERILGDGVFVENVLRDSEEKIEKREKLIREGWDVIKLAKHVCKLLNVEEGLVKKKNIRKTVAEARRLIAYWGTYELGINGKEIGLYFGITKQAVSYMSKQGEKLAVEKKYLLTF